MGYSVMAKLMYHNLEERWLNLRDNPFIVYILFGKNESGKVSEGFYV